MPLTLAIPFGAFFSGRLMSWSGRYKPLQLVASLVAPLAIVSLAFVDPHAVVLTGLVMVTPGLAIGLQLPSGLVATQERRARAPGGRGHGADRLLSHAGRRGRRGGADHGADRAVAPWRHGRYRTWAAAKTSS
ncbi:hypothetical protein ACU4GD_01570 [Cupriavidus basilensis]